MGVALARCFLTAGYKTTVWNRSPARAEALRGEGALVATTAAECIAASELAIFCLIDPAAVHDVLEKLEARSGTGRILVDYTTGSPAQIRRSNEIATQRCFKAYVRGVIMAFPAYVGSPDISLYYSGDEEAFKAVEDVVKLLGTSVYQGPDPVSSSVYEFIMVSCMYGFAGGFLNAIALLKAANLYTEGGAQNFVNKQIGPTLTESFRNIFGDLARQIDSKDYVTKGDGARLDQQVKALSNLIKTNKEMGLSGIMFEPMLTLMKARVAQGGAAEEMSALVETLAEPSLVDIYRHRSDLISSEE